MTKSELHNILDRKPQTAEIDFGPEPSLREILEKYYLQHMSKNEADACMKAYIADLEAIVDIKGIF